MFQLVFFKLRNTYNLCAKSYMLFMIERPYHFVNGFLIVTLMLGFGLFQTKLNIEVESLTMVRDSQTIQDAALINRTFVLDQHKRHFINKLIDFGHYVEIIVTVKAPDGLCRKSNDDLLKSEYTLMNHTVLDEFNKLYDMIVNLEIEDYEDEDYYNADLSSKDSESRSSLQEEFRSKNADKTLKRYRYANDLCAKRLEKCSIEGGLARVANFQNNLLNHNVDYQPKEPKSSYGDTDSMDGFSVNVFFGKYRKEVQADNDTASYYGVRHVITHASTFRIRFNLLNSNQREKVSFQV